MEDNYSLPTFDKAKSHIYIDNLKRLSSNDVFNSNDKKQPASFRDFTKSSDNIPKLRDDSMVEYKANPNFGGHEDYEFEQERALTG
jgi:hypothetical protein